MASDSDVEDWVLFDVEDCLDSTQSKTDIPQLTTTKLNNWNLSASAKINKEIRECLNHSFHTLGEAPKSSTFLETPCGWVVEDMLSRPSETSLSCDFFEPPRAASVRIEELTKYAHRGKSLRIKRMIGEQSETSGFQIMGSVTMAPDVKISKVVSEKDDDLMPRKSSHELLVAINFQPTLALQNELADAFIPCTPIKELCEDSSCDKFSLVGFFVNSVFKPIALMVKSYALEDPDDLAELGSFLFLHGISGLEDIAGDIF